MRNKENVHRFLRRGKPGSLRPISLKVIPTKEKEKRKRKSVEEKRRRREKKKAMIVPLVFMATLTTKRLFDGRGLFGGDVFKNPARYKNY